MFASLSDYVLFIDASYQVLRVGNRGYGILVSPVPKETKAFFSLKDPAEVQFCLLLFFLRFHFFFFSLVDLKAVFKFKCR